MADSDEKKPGGAPVEQTVAPNAEALAKALADGPKRPPTMPVEPTVAPPSKQPPASTEAATVAPRSQAPAAAAPGAAPAVEATVAPSPAVVAALTGSDAGQVEQHRRRTMETRPTDPPPMEDASGGADAPAGGGDKSTRVLTGAAAAADKATAAGTRGGSRRGGAGKDDLAGGDQEFCGYRIVRKLAEGGMGAVYIGEHTKIGRKGAIKVLKPELCTDEVVVERFYQEARAVNSIRHENIVDIYDFGRDDAGRVFFVMELLDGESLADRLKKGALPWREALPILEQTLRALRAAHDKGFVHRDLKPDNIWLQPRDDGGVRVKLLDFGIAKLVGMDNAQEKLTKTGSIMGTPHYMSPEQIGGTAVVDHRTDVYAMGIIIHELFTGHVPFEGDTLASIMTGHLFTDPPPLEPAAELGVPAGVAAVVDRMLAKQPGERYASVMDVLADLKESGSGRAPSIVSQLDRTAPRQKATVPGGVTTPEASAPAPAAPKSRTGLYLGIAGVAAAGVVAALVLGGGKQGAKPSAAPRPAETTPGSGKPGESPSLPPIDVEAARKSALATLHQALRHAESPVRVRGADGAGDARDQESVPRLAEMASGDPDLEVRGHAAGALGKLAAAAEVQKLGALEGSAPPALKVWYAAAQARVGDAKARKRLIIYAKDPELAVSFKAALALADVSESGDKEAIKALTTLAAREAELNDIAPYAGALLLTRLAQLHHEKARGVLVELLQQKDEGARMAAAEGLARLGDESGRSVLTATMQNQASPNRAMAARALVLLGDYAGFELLSSCVGDAEARVRTTCAKGLGEIGEHESLRGLLPLLEDKQWEVRVAAAVAVLAIVGLDPKLLAAASVDWARGALDSEDWAVRKAAAGVLGDLPEEEAVPLLAAAIVDPEPEVRRAAAKSAAKMKSPAAAQTVADAALAEKDPSVQEEQIVALAEIGSPVAKPALEQLAAAAGRNGVLASGSLVAIGEVAAAERLVAAVKESKDELRLAAVDGAIIAKNTVAVPALAAGVTDRRFEIRFRAAEGLAGYGAEKSAAVKVLEEGLGNRDLAVQARARAALLRLGERPAGGATPEELLASPDPAVRKLAVAPIEAMPWPEAQPLMRRVLADPHPEVRAAGLAALRKREQAQQQDVVRMYKGARNDAAPQNRAVAQGRLSALLPPVGGQPAQKTQAPAAPDLEPVRKAAAEGKAALEQARAERAVVAEKLAALAKLRAKPSPEEEDLAAAATLSAEAAAAAERAKQAAANANTALAAARAAAAGAGAEGEALVAEAEATAEQADAEAQAAAADGETAQKEAAAFQKSESGDADILLASGEAALAAGKLGDAKRDLERAEKAYAAQGRKNPAVEFAWGRLYDKQAERAKDDDSRAKLLERAKKHYEAFTRGGGSGAKAARAKERIEEIDEELASLGK